MNIGKVFTCKIPDYLNPDKVKIVDEDAIMDWAKTADWKEAFTGVKDSVEPKIEEDE